MQAVAAQAYGAPSPAHVAVGPGTQALLPLVTGLARPGLARILVPTYSGHAPAARLAGHHVEPVTDFDALAPADVAILVNPNNPDGRIVERERLLALAAAMRRRGGLLVVDEAFMEVGPQDASLADAVGDGGLVVLRSFGKFFGLAGLRLGFALCAPPMADLLRRRLGPWAVSGPALACGLAALGDHGWQAAMRGRLALEATALDARLAAHGVKVIGGTRLFRYVRDPDAQGLFRTLGEAGIFVRRFAGRPDCLRFGLPPDEAASERLDAALARFRSRKGETP